MEKNNSKSDSQVLDVMKRAEMTDLKNRVKEAWDDPQMQNDLMEFILQLAEDELRGDYDDIDEEIEAYLDAIFHHDDLPELSREAAIELFENMGEHLYSYVTADDERSEVYYAGIAVMMEIMSEMTQLAVEYGLVPDPEMYDDDLDDFIPF